MSEEEFLKTLDNACSGDENAKEDIRKEKIFLDAKIRGLELIIYKLAKDMELSTAQFLTYENIIERVSIWYENTRKDRYK